MPRVTRDSDEDVESKSSVRRTRAASTVSVTDSPLRRTTRSNKQLSVIESSPESVDESNAQPAVRTTRSRAATLDKSATAGVTKSLRSRKNSVSSNLSETIDLESETTQKRITRKAAATASALGTPTKSNLRSRNLRAGSEVKSTPTKSKRVTRASSVDPVNTPNELLGTPVRRRTRASIVPLQQTVAEEQEATNKAEKSLNNTVVEIDDGSENESISPKGKPNKKGSKASKDVEKDTCNEQSILDTSNSIEANMTDKSCTSNETNEESTLKAHTSHSINFMLKSSTSGEKEISENIDTMTSSVSLILSETETQIKSEELDSSIKENDDSLAKSNVQPNDIECELVDIENYTLTDESVDVINSPPNVNVRDPLALDIKDSYVKLNRTNLVEKIASEKLGNNVNNDDVFVKTNDSDSVSQNDVITNAKTAIVLVNDCVKSNDYFSMMKNENIFDSGISLNNKEVVSSNAFTLNSEDDHVTIVSIEDDEMLSLSLSSPNPKETQDNQTITDALPDNEKIDFDNITDEFISVNLNSNNIPNIVPKKSDVHLKENGVLESNLKSENSMHMNEENNKMETSETVKDTEIINVVHEMRDEKHSDFESEKNVDTLKNANASHDRVDISRNSLQEITHSDMLVSVDADGSGIMSVNVKSPVNDIDVAVAGSKTDTKIEVIDTFKVENACDIVTKNRVGSEENNASKDSIPLNLNDIQKNEPVNVTESCSTEVTQLNDVKLDISARVTNTTKQLEPMDTSLSEPNSNENHHIENCVLNEINSNQTETNLSEDKNGVISAVTDADGENASSHTKDEESNETGTDSTPNKSPEKQKGKHSSRLIDSDSDESADDLFQDIPAEEWSKEQSSRKSIEPKNENKDGNKSTSFDKDKSVVEEAGDEEPDVNVSKKSRKSLNKKELDKSTEEVTDVTENQEVNQSLSKKARKSLEKKRESNQSSDSGIQDGSNKTIVDLDAVESDNESRKNRRSLNDSRKINQSLSKKKNEVTTEVLSTSLNESKSLNKSRKSMNTSAQYNLSVYDSLRKKNDSLSESLSTSLTNSNSSKRHSLNNTQKSIVEEKIDEYPEEPMEVDDPSDNENEMNKANDSPNKSRKSLNKSQIKQSPFKNNSTAEKLSASFNASTASRSSALDKSLNKSSRKSQVDVVPEENISKNEDVVNVSNTSVVEITNDKSLSKNRKSLNQSSTSKQNESLSENLSTSLNDSKKSLKRLKLNESPRKSLSKDQSMDKSSDKEMEADVVIEKSPQKARKSLNSSSSNKSVSPTKVVDNTETEVLSKNKDKSLKDTSVRKSIDESSRGSDVLVDNESDSETDKEYQKKNKSISKSPKRTSKSPAKASSDDEKTDESMTESSPKKGRKSGSTQSVLDKSLRNSIDRMKFANPPNHDLSTVVQVNSDSDSNDSDDDDIPNFMFKLSDSDETKDSSDGEENDVDSDIEREYNLAGKKITKYSDDDVPADDCRGSEEEFSDPEDDGTDLQDFVVPDDVEDDEEDEESNDEKNDHDDEDEDDEDLEKEEKTSKKDVSVSSSQSTLKNTSGRKSVISASSGSESDDEATEAENKNSNEGLGVLEDSEKLLQDANKIKARSARLLNMIEDMNTSLQKADKSMNKSSKSAKSNVSSTSISEAEDTSEKDENRTPTKEKSVNASVKNKSLNLSKSVKDKSANLSKSIAKDKSITVLDDSKSSKYKSVRIEENCSTEASESESDDYVEEEEDSEIASPTESEAEEGEDSLHIVSKQSKDKNSLKSKNKKLIECSTPKPGVSKKSDFSKDNLSIAASKRKSGSLNDLTDTKVMSSRMSISEAASKSLKPGDTSIQLKDDVEIVATPETVTKTRQAWKLIPLNQTAHPAAEETPGTKLLKKSKLNDSFPVLESMKSTDLSLSTSSKTKKEQKSMSKVSEAEEALPKDLKNSKKRKLLDMSNVQSVDEDSILKVSKKNKKRARIDESIVSENKEEVEVENVEKGKKKKKKDKQVNDEEAVAVESVEDVQKSKKKKKNKSEEKVEEEIIENPDESEEKPKKKKKKKKSSQELEEEDQSVESVKSKKKKSKLSSEAEPEEPVDKKSKKKSKKQVAGDSDDEAPESVGFDEARRLHLTEMQQQTDSLKAMKEALKKDATKRAQKAKETKSLKRLPDDVLDSLTDEPLRRPDKRQKLSRNKERSVIMPSKSMFSPGKTTPENLRVDDGYIPLSSTGGTTQFAVINLQKAKKAVKKNPVVLNFREKMLARNKRMPTSAYLAYQQKIKAKNGK